MRRDLPLSRSPELLTPSPSASRTADPPCATVVIPCLNGASTIAAQVDALAQQPEIGQCEVVIADNGSTDTTTTIVRELAQRYSWLRLVDASRCGGINHARNVGVQSARGSVILLCDADDLVGDAWLRHMLRAFAEGATIAGGSLRRVRAGRPAAPVMIEGLQDDLRFLPWPQGANCGFTAAIYAELAGFDESYVAGGDETDFFWRAQLAGYELRHVKEALVVYRQRPSARARIRQQRGFGRSHVQLFARYRQSGMRRSSPLKAAGFWLGIPVWALLSLRSPDDRLRFAARFGTRLGRIEGMIRFRAFYP